MFFGKARTISTDAAKIETLLTRGVASLIPRELAEKKLRSGERLRVYLGIDPTGAKLHLGHSVPLRKLQAFADLGHEVVFLVGSFTAMIGDPSGRDMMREPLTREQVEANFKDYKRQASRVLDFSKITVRYNHEWLEKLDFGDIVKLASHFTVQQLVARDMFEKRMKEGKPIALHEFLYPLMVGYDSVVLDVDCELGGSDQEFNILAGRQLQTALKKRDKFVLTTKLIEGTDGRKMSKTYNNCVYLEDSPGEMFGKLMSVKDELMPTYFETLTDVPAEEQKRILGGHPKEAKLALAEIITTMYHGPAVAKSAREGFEQAFVKGGTTDALELTLSPGGIRDTLVASGVIASNSEFTRLAEAGAIRIIDTDEKITDPKSAPKGKSLRIGKHRFVKFAE